MRDRIINILKNEYDKYKTAVPWDGMWDEAANQVVKLVEKKMKKKLDLYCISFVSLGMIFKLKKGKITNE